MHLDVEALRSLVEVGEPLAHLLDCAACRSRLRSVRDLGAPPPLQLTGAYETALGRALLKTDQREEQLAEETDKAAQLFSDLLKTPLEEIRTMDQPEFWTRGCVVFLLQKGEDAQDPRGAFHCAHLALSVLERLDEGPETLRLRARASCLVADSQRRQGLAEMAADTLHHAADFLDIEPLTAPIRALFSHTLAGVRAQQRRIDEALALIERACAIAKDNGDWLQYARSRLLQGWLLLEEIDHDGALDALREAAVLLDPAEHPQLLFSALHALALTYADLNRQDDLQRVLDSLRQMRPVLPGRIYALRGRWIRAQAHWRLGQAASAISRLHRVFDALVEEGMAVDAAMAALELAHWALETDPPKTRLVAELRAALEPFAQDRRLPSWIWNVVSFALTFGERRLGFYLSVLLSAIRYVQMAEFNSALPFYPLPGPDEIAESIPAEHLKKAADAGGVELVEARLNPTDRLRLAWAYEALTGVRVQGEFSVGEPDGGAGLLPA
jgi:tetratricopeptide (TPR) repeat protein